MEFMMNKSQPLQDYCLEELGAILLRIQEARNSQINSGDYAPVSTKAIKALSALESAYGSMGGKLSDVYTSN